MSIVGVVSIVLIAIFALVAFGNWYLLIRFLLNGEHSSVVPFLGGILGASGFLLSLHPTLRHLWWLPSILDYGSIPSATSWLFLLVRSRVHQAER